MVSTCSDRTLVVTRTWTIANAYFHELASLWSSFHSKKKNIMKADMQGKKKRTMSRGKFSSDPCHRRFSEAYTTATESIGTKESFSLPTEAWIGEREARGFLKEESLVLFSSALDYASGRRKKEQRDERKNKILVL